MRLSRPFSVLGLAALSFLLGDVADAAPKKAKLKGLFDVADPQTDGKLKGVVQTSGGTVVFLLEATLKDATPTGATGVAGTVDGVLRNQATGNVVAHVKGKYVGGPGGKGKLKALVLKQASSGGAPTVVGKLKAKWIDPNAVGTAGKFKGRAAFK